MSEINKSCFNININFKMLETMETFSKSWKIFRENVENMKLKKFVTNITRISNFNLKPGMRLKT